MAREIRKKSLANIIGEHISDFKLFSFLALFTLIIGITFYLTTKSHEVRQQAFGTDIEFGFNNHLSTAGSFNLSQFKANIDSIAGNNQKWVRFAINSSDIAQEAPAPTPTPNIVLPPTLTPTPTPLIPPSATPTPINVVLGLASNPILWNTTNLALYDQAIDYAVTKGLKIFLATKTPDFANNYSFNDYITVTDQYFQFLSNRYKGKIIIWQVFNDSNVKNYTDSPPITTLDPTYLTNLNTVLGSARNAIKTNDSNALITTSAGGIPLNDTLVNSWNQFFDAINTNLDIISVNIYPFTDLTEISKLGNIVDSLKTRYAKDIAVSEAGFCTQNGVYTENDQQTYLTQTIGNLKLSSVKLILQYEIMDQDSTSGNCDNTYGLIRTDGTQKISYPAVMSAMQPLPTPTPTPTNTPTPIQASTSTPTPFPTKTPTPTPLPATKGILAVSVIPVINATIKIVNSSTNKIVITAQGNINNLPILVGNYYVTFSYPKTSGLRIPRTTSFKINSLRATQISGNFTTGKTTVVYK